MAVEPAVSGFERGGAASENTDAVALDGVGRHYGERAALRDVTLRLPRGCTLAVFGPNGAGKTTLLRMLATLLVPHEGELLVFGHRLPREAYRVRPRVGLLAHDPLLYHDLSGRENLRFYARLYGVEDPDARIAHLLEVTGMTARADEPVRYLSRGMAQRIGICRAVLHRPDLLLLDEPRAHLDPEAAAMAEPLIGARAGATRVLVTHEIDHGLAEADRVLGLREGAALIDAPAASLDARVVRSLYGAAS
ncbi:MAG: ABC transporter ATP-binding protein [Solirubrobacterales bacterium]